MTKNTENTEPQGHEQGQEPSPEILDEELRTRVRAIFAGHAARMLSMREHNRERGRIVRVYRKAAEFDALWEKDQQHREHSARGGQMRGKSSRKYREQYDVFSRAHDEIAAQPNHAGSIRREQILRHIRAAGGDDKLKAAAAVLAVRVKAVPEKTLQRWLAEKNEPLVVSQLR